MFDACLKVTGHQSSQASYCAAVCKPHGQCCLCTFFHACATSAVHLQTRSCPCSRLSKALHEVQNLELTCPGSCAHSLSCSPQVDLQRKLMAGSSPNGKSLGHSIDSLTLNPEGNLILGTADGSVHVMRSPSHSGAAHQLSSNGSRWGMDPLARDAPSQDSATSLGTSFARLKRHS